MQSQSQLCNLLEQNQALLSPDEQAKPAPHYILKNSYYLIILGQSDFSQFSVAVDLANTYPMNSHFVYLDSMTCINDLVGLFKKITTSNGKKLKIWNEGPLTTAVRLGKMLVLVNFDLAHQSLKKHVFNIIKMRYVKANNRKHFFDSNFRLLILTADYNMYRDSKKAVSEDPATIKFQTNFLFDQNQFKVLQNCPGLSQELYKQLSHCLELKRFNAKEPFRVIVRDVFCQGSFNKMMQNPHLLKLMNFNHSGSEYDRKRLENILDTYNYSLRDLYPANLDHEIALSSKIHNAIAYGLNLFVYGINLPESHDFWEKIFIPLKKKVHFLKLYPHTDIDKFKVETFTTTEYLDLLLEDFRDIVRQLGLEKSNAGLIAELTRLNENNTREFLSKVLESAQTLLKQTDVGKRSRHFRHLSNFIRKTNFFISEQFEQRQEKFYQTITFEEYIAVLAQEYDIVIIENIQHLNDD